MEKILILIAIVTTVLITYLDVKREMLEKELAVKRTECKYLRNELDFYKVKYRELAEKVPNAEKL